MAHTDIVRTGWVARLPAAWLPYALLARADRAIGFWLLFLPGLWAIALAAPGWGAGIWLGVLFGVGSVAMRAAGCVVNDMWDRDLDRQVARTAGRPLAAGMLRMRHALMFLAGLLAVGLGILLQLDPAAQVLGVMSLVLVATYPLAKRVTWWPQLMLGVTFGWGAPMGFAAATGTMAPAGLLLYGAAILWILGYDTIYAHQDREDDALIGVRSTARLFAERSRAFVGACYAGAVVLLLLAGWAGGLGWGFAVGMAVAGWMLWRQVRGLDIEDPALCLRLFQANREVGLVVAGAILLGRL